MSSSDDLKSRFLEFRKRKYAPLVGLALALVVGSVLTYFLGAVCFGALLIALVGYYVPYYFGFKDKKKLAVWGLAFILVLSIPFTLGSAVGNVNAFEDFPLESANGVLVGGHVDPFRGEAGTAHTFNVTLTTEATGAEVRVIVFDQANFEELGNLSMAEAGPAVGGTNYSLTTDIAGGSLYSYRFVTNATGSWISTMEGYGPVHWTDTQIFTYFLPFMALALMLQAGLLFYLLLLFSWFTDRSKARMAEAMKQREQAQKPAAPVEGKEEKFVCSECGADVPANAGRCPQCGESFDEEGATKTEKAQFECSECGANVDAGAKRCWNCGKEFEN